MPWVSMLMLLPSTGAQEGQATHWSLQYGATLVWWMVEPRAQRTPSHVRPTPSQLKR